MALRLLAERRKPKGYSLCGFEPQCDDKCSETGGLAPGRYIAQGLRESRPAVKGGTSLALDLLEKAAILLPYEFCTSCRSSVETCLRG